MPDHWVETCLSSLNLLYIKNKNRKPKIVYTTPTVNSLERFISLSKFWTILIFGAILYPTTDIARHKKHMANSGVKLPLGTRCGWLEIIMLCGKIKIQKIAPMKYGNSNINLGVIIVLTTKASVNTMKRYKKKVLICLE